MASITFVGEEPVSFLVSDIAVNAERIQSDVRGVVADVDRLSGATTTQHVTVSGKDAKGNVEGVRLTKYD